MGFFPVSLNSHTYHAKWEHLLPVRRGALLKDAPWNRHLLRFSLNLAPANRVSARSQLIQEERREQPLVFPPAAQKSLLGVRSSTTSMVSMTWDKMTSLPLSWMALDIVFFSITDQNKEMQEEDSVLPHLLTHGSSQVTLELPTVLRAALNLSTASRGGTTEPQGNCLVFFWSPGNSTQGS